MIDTGHHPHMGFEHQAPLKVESVSEFTDRMEMGLDEMKAGLTEVKDEYVMYYNHQREPALVVTPGDKVWLDRSNITTNRPSSKLSHH
jgi:hypothetical protein